MKQANIKHTFFKYVSLNIVGMVGLSCYILADTFFIAQGVGVDGLAALNLAIPIYSFVNGVGLMIGMGGATRYSISQSEQVFSQSLYYTLVAGGVFLSVGVFLSAQLSALLGADGDTLRHTSVYLQTILCFAPMFLLNNVILCFVRNDGNPKLAMIAMLTGSFSNIVLDYIFIFPLDMGMFGAAFATGIAPVISLLCLSAHFLRKRNTFRLSGQKPQYSALMDITALGASALITELSAGIVILVFNGIILGISGNTGVAAYGIVANIALVITAVFSGISQGMQPILSACYGQKNSADITTVLRWGLVTAVSISLAVYAVSLLFTEGIVGAFNRDSNLQLAEIAANGLRIYFTAFPFMGINILCTAYFSAIDSPKNAFLISMLRGFVVIIPTAVFLSALFGINGVWMSVTTTELIVLLCSVAMLRAKRGRIAAL